MMVPYSGRPRVNFRRYLRHKNFDFLVFQFFHVNIGAVVVVIGVTLREARDFLGISGIRNVRLFNRYDIEGIKLVEIMRIDGEVKYAHYFSRKGDTISVHNWRINLSATDRVKAKIKENFIVNDLTYTRSMASLLLILDFENNIFEIRIEGGINQDFNKELLRVIKEIEKDLIFICTTDCQMPIVTPFPLWIIDRQ